jgi:hypothetical protein
MSRELFVEASAEAAELERDGAGYVYDNPLEKKRVVEIAEPRPRHIGEMIDRLSSPEWLEFLSQMTGIDRPLVDHIGYGSGLSIVPPGGFLGLHRDLELHPKANLERRVNLCLFLTHSWDDAWGGHLEFWSEFGGRPKACARRIRPVFGRIVLFDPQGLHGFPEPIRCPQPVCRLSLQLFYYTQPRPTAKRTRAWFYLRPGEDCEQKLNDFRLSVRRT